MELHTFQLFTSTDAFAILDDPFAILDFVLHATRIGRWQCVEGEGRDKGSQVASAANLAATTHSAIVRRRMFVFRDDLRQINVLMLRRQ